MDEQTVTKFTIKAEFGATSTLPPDAAMMHSSLELLKDVAKEFAISLPHYLEISDYHLSISVSDTQSNRSVARD